MKKLRNIPIQVYGICVSMSIPNLINMLEVTTPLQGGYSHWNALVRASHKPEACPCRCQEHIDINSLYYPILHLLAYDISQVIL